MSKPESWVELDLEQMPHIQARLADYYFRLMPGFRRWLQARDSRMALLQQHGEAPSQAEVPSSSHLRYSESILRL